MRARFIALTSALLIGATDVAALEQPFAIDGLSLAFRGDPPVGRSLKVTATGITLLPASGGEFPGGTGGTVVVDMAAAGSLTCELAAGAYDGRRGWRALGTPPGARGYKYVDRDAPVSGPCRSLVVKTGALKLRAAGTGSLAAPLGVPPGSPDIGVSLGLGDVTYCGLARAPHARERAGRSIRASDQPAPLACDAPTTTTVTIGSTTTTGEPPPCGSGSKCVFVSSQVWDGTLGGLAGADLKCQQAADAGLVWLHGRTFRAWLSDRTTSAAARLTHAAMPYRLVDGTEIASSWTDLTDGMLAHAIDRTEQGVAPGLPEYAWTGTNPDGSIYTTIPPSYFCEDWTYIFWDALVGIAGAADATWTAYSSSPQAQTCDASYHLYCFEQ